MASALVFQAGSPRQMVLNVLRVRLVSSLIPVGTVKVSRFIEF
jgi:hypothetical protein